MALLKTRTAFALVTLCWISSALCSPLMNHSLMQRDACGIDTSSFQKWSALYGTSTVNTPVTISGPVLLDVSSVTTPQGITIANGGWLLVDWDTKDITITTPAITVNGKFQIGSSACRFSNKITIDLISDGTTFKLDGNDVGTRTVAVGSNGILDVWGAKGTQYPWTTLSSTATAGATSIQLADPVAGTGSQDWAVGDQIVISTTDWSVSQMETATISAITDSKTIQLSAPLKYLHYGELETLGGKTVDQRAEVGLLSRNILIRGGTNRGYDTSGHVIFLKGNKGIHMEGVELFNMGQRDIGRYPIHFHMVGDASGSVIRANSIHQSNFRCVTVHGSNGVIVDANVAYDHKGHCMFLEDGVETNNTFQNNLVLFTQEKTEGQWLGSDKYPGVAGYWITNPDNTYINNVAGGSVGAGFWIETRLGPRGLHANNPAFQNIKPYLTPLKKFSGNVAHSCDHGMQVDATAFEGSVPSNPADPPVAAYAPVNPDGSPATIDIESFTAHHNRFRGIWMRDMHIALTNGRFTNNFVGVELATSGDHVISSSVVVDGTVFEGFSANVGSNMDDSHQSWDATMSRSWPRQGTAWVGMVIYDGPITVKNSHFENFSPSPDSSPHSAIGTRFSNNFQMATTSSVSDCTFSNVARKAWTTDKTADGGKTFNFVDKTGSVTGKTSATVLPNFNIYNAQGCSQDSAYGLACPHHYAQLWTLDMSPGAANPMHLTRNEHAGSDHSSYALTFAGFASAGVNRYQSIVSIGASYLVHFENYNTKDLVLQLNNADANEAVTIAVCYPAGTQIDSVNRGLANWIGGPILPQKGTKTSPLTSASSKDATSGGDSYYYDQSRGLLVVTLKQRNNRKAETGNFCPDEGCDFVWISTQATTGSAGDCYSRVYSGDSLQITSDSWMRDRKSVV